jgi:hypothetical protein
MAEPTSFPARGSWGLSRNRLSERAGRRQPRQPDRLKAPVRASQSLYALNRGVVSRLGLARMDVKKLAMAAQTQTNWMPRVLGP